MKCERCDRILMWSGMKWADHNCKMKTWKQFINTEMKEDYFKSLSKFLLQEEKQYTIYPNKSDIFNVFSSCPIDKVKIILLGQDPYINDNEAHGLAFSVADKNISIPPSLRNIYKEIENDLGIEMPNHGNLTGWAEQGVFLLNSVLTVRKGSSGSHRNKGWETFTDKAIQLVNQLDRPIVYMLFGSYAKSKKLLITNKNSLVLEAIHPSPLSANRGGFFGGKYFSKANEFLVKNNIEPIDWRL